jgi:bile acid:Na+ symporter, BASS family
MREMRAPSAPFHDPDRKRQSLISRFLAFIGRHGTIAFALSIFLGLALPQLAEAARPILVINVFVFTALTYARVDVDNLRATLARRGRLGLALLWAAFAPPLVLLAIVSVVGRDAIHGNLLLGLVLYCAAPVLNSSPAFAMLLGFRNGLILAILFINLLLTPLLAPPIASFLMGQDLPLTMTSLALRLSVMIFGATLGAIALRWWLGGPRIAALKHEFDGINVILFFLFAVAAMDGVIEMTTADPWRTAFYLGLAFGLSTLMFLISLIVTRRFGLNDGFALSIGVGFRNVGLLVAAFGPSLPAESYLYFSLSQFPTYLAPMLIAPLARRYAGRD